METSRGVGGQQRAGSRMQGWQEVGLWHRRPSGRVWSLQQLLTSFVHKELVLASHSPVCWMFFRVGFSLFDVFLLRVPRCSWSLWVEERQSKIILEGNCRVPKICPYHLLWKRLPA